jgi:hypothetical protein
MGRRKLNPKAYRKKQLGSDKKYRGYTLQMNDNGSCTVFRKLYEIGTYESKRLAKDAIDAFKDKLV